MAAGGLSLTLVAAVLQQLQVALHPDYFNHNAVFHVVQAVAMLLFFLGGRSLASDRLARCRQRRATSIRFTRLTLAGN